MEKRKRLKVVAIIVGVVALLVLVLALATAWVLPKQGAVQQVNNLDENPLTSQAKEVIALLDANDFEALQSMSTAEMAPALNAEKFGEVRAGFGENWGKQELLGGAYVVEVSQMGQPSDVVQVTAFYENATVTYTISFTKDGQLAGIFLK